MKTKIIAILSLSHPLISCSTYEKDPFIAFAVSMTVTKLPDTCLELGQRVEETWCQNELLEKDAESMGLFDEVILKAQRKHKVDVLLDSKIWVVEQDGLHCAKLIAHVPAACRNDYK